jgi:hypothetical protein
VTNIGKQNPENPVNPENPAFQLNQLVMCRDKGDDVWVHGKVTSIDPLKVMPEWAASSLQSYKYDHVESMPEDVEALPDTQFDPELKLNDRVFCSYDRKEWSTAKVVSLNPLRARFIPSKYPYEENKCNFVRQIRIGDSVQCRKNNNDWSIYAKKVSELNPLKVALNSQPGVSRECKYVRPMPPSFISRMKSNITGMPSSVPKGGKRIRRKQTRKRRKQTRKQTRKQRKSSTNTNMKIGKRSPQKKTLRKR